MAINATYWFPVPNITTPVELIHHVTYDITGGMFGLAILLMIFVISVLSLRTDITKSIPISLFITTISSLLLSLLQIVPPEYVAGLTGATAVSIFLIRE